MHCLKKHIDVNRLEFLPYHFLLVSVVFYINQQVQNKIKISLKGNAGWLKYQDTSTGQLVAELRTKLGPCDALKQNPRFSRNVT
jgi:U3 small nucleolar RNA-associated protein 7